MSASIGAYLEPQLQPVVALRKEAPESAPKFLRSCRSSRWLEIRRGVIRFPHTLGNYVAIALDEPLLSLE